MSMIQDDFLVTKTSEEKAHATYGASSSKRWLNCHGSIRLISEAPPAKETSYAAEGTEAHACLEFILKNRSNLKAAYAMAAKRWPGEMVNHAIDAWDYLEKRLAEHPDAEFLTETRVDASPYTREGEFGTLDAAIVEPFGKLIVVDYKYGAGVIVDPEENEQLIYYALGLSYQYDHNFSEVEIVVIQPRGYHESGKTTRTWTTSVDTLLLWADRFREGVKACEDPFAETKAGDWCQFCPAAVICPSIKEEQFAKAKVIFKDETGEIETLEPKTIAIKNLGTILSAFKPLRQWMDAVEEHALHVLERGEPVKGWKLVEKKSIRKWVDIEKVSRDAKKKFGDLAFSAPEILSPAQLEKAIKEIDSSWISARVTNQASGFTIVPESDKRQGINRGQAVFKEEREEDDMAKKKATKKKTKKARK